MLLNKGMRSVGCSTREVLQRRQMEHYRKNICGLPQRVYRDAPLCDHVTTPEARLRAPLIKEHEVSESVGLFAYID